MTKKATTVQLPPGRFLVIEVEPDLAAARTTEKALWWGLQLVPGVRSITDIAFVDPASLRALHWSRQPRYQDACAPLKPRRQRKARIA